jgi:hypothetical protein
LLADDANCLAATQNSRSAADGERAEQQVMMSPMKEPPAEA